MAKERGQGGSSTPASLAPAQAGAAIHDSRNGVGFGTQPQPLQVKSSHGNIGRRDPNVGYQGAATVESKMPRASPAAPRSPRKPFVHQPYSSGAPII